VQLVRFGRLPSELWNELVAGEEDPFEHGDSQIEWRRKEHHVVLRDDAGAPVASAGLVVAEVDAGGGSFAVVGIGGVIVAQRFRGQGHARTLLAAAIEDAGRLGPELAMLFALPSRAGLYRKLGFAEIDVPVRVQQPGGPVTMDPELGMWRALRPGATWPCGPVSLLGPPF
jgi:GNAT superfamily N-acetyltransferase